MRNTSLLLLIAVVLTATSCFNKNKNARAYLSNINEQQNNFMLKFEALDKACYELSADEMNKAFDEAVKQLEMSREETQKLAQFQGEDDLRDEAAQLYDVYESVLKSEFSQMLDLLVKPKGTFTPKDQWLVENLQTRIYKSIEKAEAKFDEAINVFALKYELYDTKEKD